MPDTHHFDLIVRNATIIDDTEAPRYTGEISVRDRIAEIGRLDRAKADVEIVNGVPVWREGRAMGRGRGGC